MLILDFSFKQLNFSSLARPAELPLKTKGIESVKNKFDSKGIEVIQIWPRPQWPKRIKCNF